MSSSVVGEKKKVWETKETRDNIYKDVSKKWSVILTLFFILLVLIIFLLVFIWAEGPIRQAVHPNDLLLNNTKQELRFYNNADYGREVHWSCQGNSYWHGIAAKITTELSVLNNAFHISSMHGLFLYAHLCERKDIFILSNILIMR